jgi:hypothetical protein
MIPRAFGRKPYEARLREVKRGGANLREAPVTIDDDLPFKIERWSKGYGEPEETIAMCADLLRRRG